MISQNLYYSAHINVSALFRHNRCFSSFYLPTSYVVQTANLFTMGVFVDRLLRPLHPPPRFQQSLPVHHPGIQHLLHYHLSDLGQRCFSSKIYSYDTSSTSFLCRSILYAKHSYLTPIFYIFNKCVVAENRNPSSTKIFRPVSISAEFPIEFSDGIYYRVSIEQCQFVVSPLRIVKIPVAL